MKNKRILIVDDNPSLHEDFKKVLLGSKKESHSRLNEAAKDLFGDEPKSNNATFDCELDFASQGEEAFKKVVAANEEGKPYALVFMDVRMPPGWDGITTIEKIWEKVPMTEMVICTAYSDYSFDDVIAKLGVSERLLFLKKPFDSVEVLQMAIAKTKKWNLEQENRKHTENLETIIKERTEELDLARARSANNAKLAALGEMAGGVAHEINNPLAIIISSISMVKELLGEEPINKPLVEKLALKIEGTTNRIAKIVKGLRTFSRSGEKDPMETASIKQMVLDTLAICGEKFKLNNVKLEFDELNTASDLMVECRSTQITQVLLNLLSNAYDAIADQKEGKWVKVGVEMTGENIFLSVTDSGRGISKEIQNKIFAPFFTTKEIGKGTGLGLSISKGIIEDHKGSLYVDSKCPNTRFVVSLPMKAITVVQGKAA